MLFEPLRRQLVELARRLDLGESVVEELEGFRVAFLEGEAEPLIGEGNADDHQLVFIGGILEGEVGGDRGVGDDAVDVAVREILVCQPDFVVGLEFDAGGLADFHNAGGADLSAHFFAHEVGKRGDAGGFLAHDEDLARVDVGLREVHGGLAFVGDGDGGSDGLIAASRESGKDAVPSSVLYLDFEAARFGDLIDEVDIEADDVLVLVDEFHGRPCGVGCDDDFGGFLGAGGESRRAENDDGREKNEGYGS